MQRAPRSGQRAAGLDLRLRPRQIQVGGPRGQPSVAGPERCAYGSSVLIPAGRVAADAPCEWMWFLTVAGLTPS